MNNSLFVEFFGTVNNVSTLQMLLRAIVVFFIALILIRISGRRSFGLRAPLDNIIIILLGAVLGRVVVAASPFIPTILACLIITLLHRLVAGLAVSYPFLDKFTKGTKIILYEEESFHKKNMKRALVSKEDIMEGLRLHASEKDLNNIERIYMERTGHLSFIKK